MHVDVQGGSNMFQCICTLRLIPAELYLSLHNPTVLKLHYEGLENRDGCYILS